MQPMGRNFDMPELDESCCHQYRTPYTYGAFKCLNENDQTPVKCPLPIVVANEWSLSSNIRSFIMAFAYVGGVHQ